MDVIDISSSPEPVPTRKRALAKRRKSVELPAKRRGIAAAHSFIEISDSDDEQPVASSSKVKAKAAPALAGPSRLAKSPSPRPFPPAPPPLNPLFVPEPVEHDPEYDPEYDPEHDTEEELEKEPQPKPPVVQLAPEALPVAEDANPLDGCIAAVLEIIPNVQPAHLRDLLEAHMPSRGSAVIEHVLHLLFEDPSYPKTDTKGKRKRKESNAEYPASREKQKPKIDYASQDRDSDGGLHYDAMSIDQLTVDFPYVPKPYIRRAFFDNNALYAPTHIFLEIQEDSGEPLPYSRKTQPTRRTGKGKARQDAAFELELEWIQLRNSGGEQAAEASESGSSKQDGDEEDGDGEGIECGCCFSSYPFAKLVQCPDAHLFCQDCITAYASGLLGEHNTKLVCMDQDGCKLPFPESELVRVLEPKLVELYHRVKQRKEIEAAGLEGLEECPFCEYKVVIENPDEKLFRCENSECGVVSCRGCQKEDHLPKSCKEMEEDKHLDGRHAIEEAMTRALMRNCPKCQKGFVKEAGCNKMTCPNCMTLSCYVCRQIIVGYDHFVNPPPYNGPQNSNKCALWDTVVEKRHVDEVNAAAKKAMDEYRAAHPDLEDKDIDVQLAPDPLPQAAPHPMPQYLGHGHAYVVFGAGGPIGYPHLPPPPPRVALPPIRRVPAAPRKRR